MKKKKKYQNQQIILNQDISIKYYINYLVFFVMNSFRVKYYYKYANYLIFFKIFKFFSLNMFMNNLVYNKLIRNVFVNLKFFRFYSSLLLNKFNNNKNFFLDKNNSYYYNKNNNLKIKNSFLYNYNFFFNCDNGEISNDYFGDLKYNNKLNYIFENINEQFFIFFYMFSFLNYVYICNLYKFYIIVLLNKII